MIYYSKRKRLFYIIFIYIILLLNIFPFTNSEYINYEILQDDFKGYTLFTPEYSNKTYLINQEGDIVHKWDSKYIQGMSVYLLENGDLVRCDLPFGNPKFMGGGITGQVELFDWNGTLLWSFNYSTDFYCLHHDVEVLPNGNILMVAWEFKTKYEAIDAGRDPSLLIDNELWPDHIIEVKPKGKSEGDIVWEWHVWDHIIQDFDSSKNNYGVIADHPELINLNYGDGHADWNHINSIDYNEDFDQILLSVRHFSEIWIIDHSTSTSEAAGHSGGNYNKGGDILYRWGNPRTYNRGDIDDQKFFGQHDAQWIEKDYPGEGNIIVFNNGVGLIPGPTSSSIDEIIPPVDDFGNYYIDNASAYGPDFKEWSYFPDNQNDFFSFHLSGVQRLPDGNTLICIGFKGYFFEITNEKEIVWDYTNPYPNKLFNHVFKIRRYYYPFLNPNAPYKPIIIGPNNGKIGIEYIYMFSAEDPNEEKIYLNIKWDGTGEIDVIGPFYSGEQIKINHSWSEEGKYDIKAMAENINGAKSDWATFEVTMSKSKAFTIPLFLQRFFQRFPLFEKILNQIQPSKFV